MITKGTEDYKKAQEIANKIVRTAGYQRWNNNSLFNLYFNDFYMFISNVKNLGTFASKVAETIDSKCNPFGYCIANVSDKQSWILACAAVENNININF